MSTLTVSNITGSPIVNASAVNIGSNAITPFAGFKNKIINGNFDFWQRGTSFSSPAQNAYNADRWYVNYDGSGATRTISRQSFTLGQTDVPNEPTYFLRHNQSVAGTGGTYNTIEQKIEGVRTLSGQTITLSFYAKAASTLNISSIYFRQNFGTGGSPSSVVDTIISGPTVGTTFTKYTYSVTLPSISGKTLGSNGDDSIIIIFTLPSNTTFTFDLAQVQIEAGSATTLWTNNSAANFYFTGCEL